MATVSSVPDRLRRVPTRTPAWLWPNLLSLDAPVVAVLWQHVFAQDANVTLAVASRAALFFTVWLIYLVDRLLDTSSAGQVGATARHGFCRLQRRLYLWLTAGVLSALVVSVLFLPKIVLESGLVASAFVVLYLMMVHSTSGPWRRWLPKEAAVGLMFGTGAAMAPLARALDALPLLPAVLLFTVLCWANTAAIEVREGGKTDKVSAWMAGHLKILAMAVCAACVALFFVQASHLSVMALMLAGFGFWAVADVQQSLSADGLRVAIDTPLLAPLLVIGLR